MNNNEIEQLTLALLTQESDRDRQRKVGASQISDPCTKHLAKALVAEQEGTGKYWLAAKIGTAVHYLLEHYVETADLDKFPQVAGAKIEQKVTFGELQNYGTISSKPDLALVGEKHLIDWKTTTREKTRKLQGYLNDVSKSGSEAEYTMQKYMAQTQLYAWGLNNSGIEIDNVSLVFISRDGKTSSDIWAHTFEYSEEFALAMWSRLERIWNDLEEGKHVESFEGHPHCFKCRTGF